MSSLSAESARITAQIKSRWDDQAEMYLDVVIGKGHDAATLQVLISMLSDRLGPDTGTWLACELCDIIKQVS
jgi:hypothetical protein